MVVIRKKIFKKALLWCIAGFIGITVTTLIINHLINNSASGKLYYNAYSIPESDVAVVLGTSRYLANGQENWFFNYRMDAAAQLYRAGKVKKILVSGDNSEMNYNEPLQMMRSLVDRGVCEEDIRLDYAGFRTFDSMVRAKEIFGLNNFIVVSQEFHCERAIYIADSKGVNVNGFVAKSPDNASKTYIREYPARVNAFLDCHVLNTKPHFLGEKINILAGL